MTSFTQLTFNLENFQMYMTFVVIIAAAILFASDRIRLELSAIITLMSLMLFFYLFPVLDTHGQNQLDAESLLQGFANPVVFTILSLLVIGQGLFQTGAVEKPAQMIAGLSKSGSLMAFAALLLSAGFISAFLNNTPVVVIFIPIATAIAVSLETSASRLLMPLSFITILGGMTTLIGSSSNLIVASLAQDNGMAPFGFFDFFIPGLFLATIGACYVIFVMPYMFQTAKKDNKSTKQKSGKQFIAQIKISKNHPWIGVQSQAGMFPELKNLTVRLIQRGDEIILPPFEDTHIESGDIVIVAATRTILTEVAKLQQSFSTRRRSTDVDNDEEQNDESNMPKTQLTMVEAVISPGSRLKGQTIEQASFLSETECTVFGLQRQSRMLRRPMRDILLEAGDVLLLLGTHEAVKNLRSNRSLITLEWSKSELPITHKAQKSILIFLLTIALAAFSLLPIAISAMIGATAMVVTGCLNLRQASRALDRRIYLLIGTAFALAEPLQVTGGAEFIANSVVNTFYHLGPAALLSAFFLLTAVLTNFLSNHATAALLAPIAVSTASKIGAPPEAFVYGLIFALNCSFATPIAYQTNLIVMGPGQYTFKDYICRGGPLVIIIWLAYSLFAPIYFSL